MKDFVNYEDMHELAKRIKANSGDSRSQCGIAMLAVADVIDDWARNLAQKEDLHEDP